MFINYLFFSSRKYTEGYLKYFCTLHSNWFIDMYFFSAMVFAKLYLTSKAKVKSSDGNMVDLWIDYLVHIELS